MEEKVIPAVRSGESLSDLAGTRSRPQLKVEEGLEVGLTHLGRSVLLWGWSRVFLQAGTLVALRCGM